MLWGIHGSARLSWSPKLKDSVQAHCKYEHNCLCVCRFQWSKLIPVSKSSVGVSLILDKTGQTVNTEGRLHPHCAERTLTARTLSDFFNGTQAIQCSTRTATNGQGERGFLFVRALLILKLTSTPTRMRYTLSTQLKVHSENYNKTGEKKTTENNGQGHSTKSQSKRRKE